MKRHYSESVPVKSSNQLRFESAPVYRSWIKCYDAQLALVAFHWWCNGLPAPDVATQMSPSAGYSQPTRHTFLNIMQYIQFGQISIFLLPAWLWVFHEHSTFDEIWCMLSWIWRPWPKLAVCPACQRARVRRLRSTARANSLLHLVCSQLCLLHTTRPQIHLLVPSLACILARASLWAVRPRSVGFWRVAVGLHGRAAWAKCVSAVGQRRRARTPTTFSFFGLAKILYWKSLTKKVYHLCFHI